MKTTDLLRATCPECGVWIGVQHEDLCDVAECLVTGLVRLGCKEGVVDAGEHDCGRSVWTGEWPGDAECREFGWYVRWDSEARGWVRCAADVPYAGPDLDRLHAQAVWNPERRRWIQQRATLYSRPTPGGRVTVEELARSLHRWCTANGYAVVGEHTGPDWPAAIADLAGGRADVLAVPALERLGHARQVATRLAEVSAAGGTVVGPDAAVAVVGHLGGGDGRPRR